MPQATFFFGTHPPPKPIEEITNETSQETIKKAASE
jgi:hypothetical protein